MSGAMERTRSSAGGTVAILPIFRRKPLALFAGDQDKTMQEINDTGDFVRARNNLNGTFFLQNPFLDLVADQATTQRRTFTFAAAGGLPSPPFVASWSRASPECRARTPCPTPRSAAPATIT